LSSVPDSSATTGEQTPPERHHGRHVPQRPPRRGHRRHLPGAVIPLVVGLVIGPVFVALYLAAFHAPVPHHLPIGVVAPEQVVTSIEQHSAEHGDAFAVTTFPTERDARDGVTDHTVDGALIVDDGRAHLFVAGANGPAVTQTLVGALTPVATALHIELSTTDLKPLPAGDTRGLSVFYAAFGIVLGAFLFGLTIMGVGRSLPHVWRAASAVVFAVLAGLVVAWLVDTVFGALPAPFLLAASIIAMLGLAIAVSTATLLRVFGGAGTFVASIVLLALGNATSTGVLPAQFLPDWLEPFTHVLPVGIAVRALRGGAYFQNDGVASAFVGLALWIIIPAAVFVLVHEFQIRSDRAPGASSDAGGIPAS